MPATPVLASLIAALIAGGCATVGRDLDVPDPRLADAWQDSASNAIGSETRRDDPSAAEWWKSFNDPVLDTLIVEAHANNLALQMAGLRVYEARATLGRESRQPDASGEPADATLRGAIASYNVSLESLTSDVATGYVLLRTLQEKLAFAASNAILQKRSLGLAQEHVRSSGRSELDVQQALALLNRTQASIPKLEYEIRQTMNALSVLLGRPPGELNAILGGVGAIPTGPDRVEAGSPADLLRHSADVREAAIAATQSAQLRVTLLKNNARVQDARLQQRIATYQLTALRVAQEVEDALTGYLKAREEVAFREATTAASQRAVDLALAPYRTNAAIYATVLDTQRLLGRDQARLTQARGNLAHHLIAAYRAMGTSRQLRLDQPFVSDEVKIQMRERTDWGGLLDPTPPPGR